MQIKHRIKFKVWRPCRVNVVHQGEDWAVAFCCMSSNAGCMWAAGRREKQRPLSGTCGSPYVYRTRYWSLVPDYVYSPIAKFQRKMFFLLGTLSRVLSTSLLLGLGRYSPYRYNIDTEGNRYISIQSSCRIDTQIWWLPQKWNNYSGKKVLVFWKQNLGTFIITYLFNEKSCKNWVLKHLELCSSKMTA